MTSSFSIACCNSFAPSSPDADQLERMSSSSAASSRNTHRLVPAAASISRSNGARNQVRRIVFDALRSTVDRDGDDLVGKSVDGLNSAIRVFNRPIGVTHPKKRFFRRLTAAPPLSTVRCALFDDQ